MKRANAVTIVEKTRRTRVRPGKANQLLAGFAGIQGKITGEEAGFSPANGKVDTRNLRKDGVQSAKVIDVGMTQNNMPDRGM